MCGHMDMCVTGNVKFFLSLFLWGLAGVAGGILLKILFLRKVWEQRARISQSSE